MPEGDTIHRLAVKLAPRLTGKRLERVTTKGLVRDVAGRTVESVTAHGKHLVIALDGGAYVRAHLGMNGRVRAYQRAEGEAVVAKLSPGRVSLALVTDDGVYLWINAPTIEISHRRAPLHGMAVATLGPDVLAEDFDPAAAAGRAAEHAGRLIAEVLLDQRLVAGIGNIYKSESLFAARVDPRRRVSELDVATLTEIYSAARLLMAASTSKRERFASAHGPFAVYSRTGQPCPRCGAAIDCYSLGEPPRWTWSCPICQPAPGPASGAARTAGHQTRRG